MTPQELKYSILQLAIQGKLVEQLPEEGTAKELYQRIQEEKQKLIKEGKIKKEKPLPEITEDEIPFDIPVDWIWIRLRDICVKIVDGDHNPPSGTKIRTEYLMLSAQNINNNTLVNLEKVRYLTKEIFYKENERTKVEKGDIFLTTVGTLGRSCVYEGNFNITFQRSVSVISTLIHNRYLKFVFDSPYIQQYMVSNSTGTAQKGFYLNQVENLAIPLPPLTEQKRIVAKIEELLPYIDRYEKAWNRLEDLNKRFPADMQKSILQMAIQGKLVEQRPEEGTAEVLYKQIQEEKKKLIKEGKIKKETPLPEITEDEIPFDIPDSWKWVRLSQLFSVLNGDRGKNYPAKSTLSHEGIPFISALNLDGKSVIEDDNLLRLSEQQYERLGNGKLIRDDIVVCIRGSLGKHGRYPFDKGAIASSLVILRAFTNDDILAEFLMMYLDTPLFFSEIRRYDNGTAQPNLAAKSLEQFLVPLPPLAEQKRIVAKLEEILPLCERLK